MAKLSYQTSLRNYKLAEYLSLYDEHSGVERILFYRLGWHLFFSSSQSFEQYAGFLLQRLRLKNFVLSIPFYLLCASIVVLLFVFRQQLNWLNSLFAAGFIAAILWIKHYLTREAVNNGSQTREFLAFINPEKKRTNFLYFEALDIGDREKAKVLYHQLLRKEDIPSQPAEADNGLLDKTVKLLTLDFLLGPPGTLQELVNKLQATSDNKLSKAGIYKVIGKVLNASSDNVKAMIEKDLQGIRTSEPSQTRIKQLTLVKNIFTEANLPLPAGEVDKLLRQ